MRCATKFSIRPVARCSTATANIWYRVASVMTLMVIYREMDREGFDTTLFCQVTGLSHEGLVRELANARVRPRAPRMVMNYMSKGGQTSFRRV